MRLQQLAISFFAGAALAATLGPAVAQNYNDRTTGPSSSGPSYGDQTMGAPYSDRTAAGSAYYQMFRFGHSNAGSDPATQLPYRATVSRPTYARGDAP